MNSNLPPGCTDMDIEIASGAVVRCEECGRVCEPRDGDEQICPRCEHAEDESV
jgi:rubrerythrin